MKKIRISKGAILPFLLGALTGAGGLKGYEYVSGAGSVPLMDRLQGDSAAVAAAAPAPASADSVTDALPALQVDTMPAVADSAAPDTTAAAVPPFAGTRAADTLAGGERLPKRRLAKLFGSMQAREAARVLEKLSDGEVEVILSQLGDREAASILSNLTPERAAQISQVVISGERSSP